MRHHIFPRGGKDVVDALPGLIDMGAGMVTDILRYLKGGLLEPVDIMEQGLACFDCFLIFHKFIK